PARGVDWRAMDRSCCRSRRAGADVCRMHRAFRTSLPLGVMPSREILCKSGSLPETRRADIQNRMASRIPLSTGAVLVLLATLEGQVEAQSLAEAAKKANESSTTTTREKSRTFTDKDLKASSSTEDGVIATSKEDVDIDPPGPVLSREEIVKRLMPAVVTIQSGNATGTGFFVGRGLIMTNHHVVGNASVVRVN